VESLLAFRNCFGILQFCGRFNFRFVFMSIKKVLLDALEKKYEAEISSGEATVKIYLENSVGIGEHPQHIEEVDKQIDKIAQAEEKLKILKSFQ